LCVTADHPLRSTLILNTRSQKGRRMLRKILLGCGIVSSVLYDFSDVLGTLRYPGYSYADQTFSELTAQGAPTRPLMVALNGIPYGVLVAAFAVGLWTSAGPKRAARITGATLLGYAAFGMAGGVLSSRCAHVRSWQRAKERCATSCTSLRRR
jgi:hypothetical protein